jgi:hypothetical protein
VGYVGQTDFRGIEVLERDFSGFEGGFKDFPALFHRPWIIRTEGERFASEVHFLKFGFILLGAIFHREVDVGGVGTGRVGCRRISYRNVCRI